MFVPASSVSLAVNLVSVLCSAFTILLTYWIVVRLVREFQGSHADAGTGSRIAAMVGGLIGACTFAVTDSFWYNAVEAEVYAMSMLFTALVVWLILRWCDMAREGGSDGMRSNRILVLVAYLFGLAIGAHLLSLLALFFIALIIFFVRFDREEWSVPGKPEWSSMRRWAGVLMALIVASGIFLIIYPGIVQKLPVFAGSTGNPLFAMFAVAAMVIGLVYYSHVRRRPVLNLASICLLMVLVGYSTYAVIFIRSAADPPIDENDPENPAAIVSYLAREQYGETPLLRGPSFNNSTGQVSRREKTFPRRYSLAPNHARFYAQYDSDTEFFWRYQVGHMYVRYFLWQFAGRESDVQDARAITGLPFLDGEYETFFQTPSERASRNKYFAIPLLLGMLGMMYHFTKDWRRAFSVLVLFLVTGIGIILYLNQTPMQPRERDYSYVASFFAFSLWIGIGATGVMQMVLEASGEKVRRLACWVLPPLMFLAVPGQMALENYDDHDRSGRYAAPDYAYNMLNSLDENAILFTNGDNDTFPLWYAQEVEGVRRDVRVANLSLLNTPWYIKQLKNQPSRDSAPLPISLPDSRIDDIEVARWQPTDLSLPVDTAALRTSSEVFAASHNLDHVESPMIWRLEGRSLGQDADGNTLRALYAADQAVVDILHTNAVQGWQRPVYFAVTVAPDGRVGLDKYFQLEGQANRVVPISSGEELGRVDPIYSPQVLRRFRFTNLDDPGVYYDDNIRNMVDNYRNVFAQTALGMIEAGYATEAVELMDWIMEEIPYETIPGDLASFVFPARAYEMAGRLDTAVEIFKRAEPFVLRNLRIDATAAQSQQMLFSMATQILDTYITVEDYEAYASFRNRINELLGIDADVTPASVRATVEGALEGDTTQSDTSSGAPDSVPDTVQEALE